MIKPTRSSSMAAVVRTVPNRVVLRPEVPTTVNVVPRLVEQRAAPAENACRALAPASTRNTYDNAIGSPIPVIATAIERPKVAFTEEYDVESPPMTEL